MRDGERVRVLRIIARMNVGGPALQVTGLMEGLDSTRFEQRLLAGTVETDEADYVALRAPELPLTRIPGLGRSPRPLDDVRALHRLRREIRAFRPHIVHTHTAKAGVLGRMAARSAAVPGLVHTFHGHLLHGYFPPWTTRVVVEVERGLARRTTRLVAVGEQVRDDLLAVGIGRHDQYVVFPPGIALPAAPSRVEARRRLSLPQDVQVVTLVARLTTIKRPERFLEIARRLAPMYPDVVFTVVGEGDMYRDLVGAAGSNVRFLGWRADVEVVYAASDLAVITSDNEGMPVSLIEAAACGVPAVSTRVGSVGEVVLDGLTGWLSEVTQDSITTAVAAALADPVALAAAGVAARAHAGGAFGRARLVADTERLYEQIANEKGF